MIDHLRARQINRDDFYRFTHIVAMDSANLQGIKARAPSDAVARAMLLLDGGPGNTRNNDVADPYYGDETDFAKAWSVINAGVEALVTRLIREGAATAR